MKELVSYLAKALVLHPEQVSVQEKDEYGALHLQLNVAAEDKGRIIGKQGRVIKAIRTLIQASGIQSHKKVSLELQ